MPMILMSTFSVAFQFPECHILFFLRSCVIPLPSTKKLAYIELQRFLQILLDFFPYSVGRANCSVTKNFVAYKTCTFTKSGDVDHG